MPWARTSGLLAAPRFAQRSAPARALCIPASARRGRAWSTRHAGCPHAAAMHADASSAPVTR
eukprot:6890624-Alexandrium_andersonii.AAC.1